MKLSYETADNDIKNLFKYYKENGFPDYKKENYDAVKEYKKIYNFDENALFNNQTKEIGQNMSGCGFLWTYFPHWKEIECNGTKSVSELWKNDDLLYNLIKKTYYWKLKHNENSWTENRIRQNAKVYLAKQTVSNFRPTVAKYYYNKYGNQGNVWDMSCGFGGRLFGFLASDCREYIGTDPSSETYNGLLKLSSDFYFINKSVKIYKQCAEEFDWKDNYFDLCFTSPPYFNTEKYSNEKTNSCNKFKVLQEWIDGFLYPMMCNCYRYTKPNGFCIVNIANVKNANNLEEWTLKIAKKIGFEHIDTHYLILSSIAGKGKKHESIFIFQKGENN